MAACHHHRCQEKNWTLPRRRETPLQITATSSSAWLEEGGKATSQLCSWGPQKGSLALCSRGYSAELFSEPGSCYPDLLLHGTGTELSTLELSLHPLPRCHQKPHIKTTPTNLHHCTAAKTKPEAGSGKRSRKAAQTTEKVTFCQDSCYLKQYKPNLLRAHHQFLLLLSSSSHPLLLT